MVTCVYAACLFLSTWKKSIIMFVTNPFSRKSILLCAHMLLSYIQVPILPSSEGLFIQVRVFMVSCFYQWFYYLIYFPLRDFICGKQKSSPQKKMFWSLKFFLAQFSSGFQIKNRKLCFPPNSPEQLENLLSLTEKSLARPHVLYEFDF